MTLSVRVTSAAWEAPLICSYELWPIDGHDLPRFTAGAHIDLNLPSGLVRSYSLINSQNERHRYVIAVQRDRNSRGGSKWVHENLQIGNIIKIDGPRNNFALNESAEKSMFIAGGIGITPILSMIDRLTALQRDWELIYCTRSRSGTAFLELLERKSTVRFNFDEEAGGKMLDIEALVRSTPQSTHLYCCGPLPMLQAFELATEGLPSELVHVEYFTAKEGPARQGGFKIVLARSGRELVVPPGKTILEALREIGVEAAHSCTEGVCGTCETKVLDGVPDHRDLVLTDNERASNKTIMICCSGSKSDELVLDL